MFGGQRHHWRGQNTLVLGPMTGVRYAAAGFVFLAGDDILLVQRIPFLFSTTLLGLRLRTTGHDPTGF